MAEALNCFFYRYTGDPRIANKSLGSPVYSCASIHPLEPLSDVQIRLIIDYPDNSSGKPAVMDANYVAIDGLYYHIDDKKRLTGAALEIIATIDGLLSYWSEISVCDSICRRSSTGTNAFIQDSLYQVFADSFNGRGVFNNAFSNDVQIVLTYVK